MNISLDIAGDVTRALKEDIGSGDLTAQLVPADQVSTATVISRETAVLCGTHWFNECFTQLDSSIRITWFVQDGDSIQPDQKLCEIQGNARLLLTGERMALNFLQTLSGTATLTRHYADAIKGTKAVVMDTRKTLPGLRMAQKYAVKIGGGENQRIGLFDGILIKENHILAAGGISEVMVQARSIAPSNVSIQIEVENLDELRLALAANAQLILLDNFTLEEMRKAVAINLGRAVLEASGNVSLESIADIAQTGVDRISVGALTKDAKAIDLSMRFVVEQRQEWSEENAKTLDA